MDAFPAQEIPGQQVFPQQVPIQPSESLVQNSIQKPPQQKVNLKKILNLGTWVMLFALLPITVLIFLSQDSVPGDLFYPVKRGMENVILAVASVNPATRAAFRTDLTETRFKEAQSLVISKANASGLASFTQDVQAVQFEVASLTDNTERAKAEEKLLVKIDQYQNSLVNLEVKTEQNLIAYSTQETPTPTSIPPTSVQNLPSATPTFTPAPTLIPATTSAPTSTLVKSFDPELRTEGQANSASPEAFVPTLTPIPTVVPAISIQQENIQAAQQEKIAQTLKDTKEKLNKIKKELEEKRGKNKSENIKKSVNSSEGENQNKNNSNKKTDANTDSFNPQAK